MAMRQQNYAQTREQAIFKDGREGDQFVLESNKSLIEKIAKQTPALSNKISQNMAPSTYDNTLIIGSGSFGSTENANVMGSIPGRKQFHYLKSRNFAGKNEQVNQSMKQDKHSELQNIKIIQDLSAPDARMTRSYYGSKDVNAMNLYRTASDKQGLTGLRQDLNFLSENTKIKAAKIKRYSVLDHTDK